MLNGFILVILLAASVIVLSDIHDSSAHDSHELLANRALSTSYSGIPPCDALLAAGLEDRVVFATDEAYEARIAAYWSVSARLRPWCLVQPRDAQEVSKALTALIDAGSDAGGWHIAIRGGGHHGWAGSNNIANGVTIDLAYLNQSSYDRATNLASVGPGDHWKDAYASLLEYNVTVTGGRDGGVGVGGYLLGGGNSYYTGRSGFGCDSVINFEVVLADSSIVNANNATNPDLFKALKGGGNNFGIVTRFDMEASPARPLYVGTRMMSRENSDAVVDAFVDFTDESESFVDDAMIVLYTHNTTMGEEDVYIAVARANTLGDENTTAFGKMNEIPAISDEMEHRDMAYHAMLNQIPGGNQSVWFTLTFKNDAAIVRKSVEIWQETVDKMKETIGAEKFIAEMYFQPIPTYFIEIGRERGGNVLGLDEEAGNAILWLALTTTTNEADEALTHALMASVTTQIEDYAISVGGNIDWRYLNYADPSQDPIKTYGRSNVEFLREVAAKYDPTGIFQTRVPGGFKISQVDKEFRREFQRKEEKGKEENPEKRVDCQLTSVRESNTACVRT